MHAWDAPKRTRYFLLRLRIGCAQAQPVVIWHPEALDTLQEHYVCIIIIIIMFITVSASLGYVQKKLKSLTGSQRHEPEHIYIHSVGHVELVNEICNHLKVAPQCNP